MTAAQAQAGMAASGWAAGVPDALASVYCVWYLMVTAVCAIGYDQLNRRFTRARRAAVASDSDAPGVTILRPLKGMDTEFEACIRSAFAQDYPTFEICFCVDSADDPAIAVVERLMKEYADVPSRLFVGAEKHGVNPKVNNLSRAYAEAAHDIVWVLDSNVYVTPGALGRSVEALARPRIQLVHHLPLCVDISGHRGSRLDEMFLATAHAKFYVAINTVSVAACITGKSNLFRRSDLNRAQPDGIRAFAPYIAEDQAIGEALWAQGGRHGMTGDAAIQPVGNVALRDYYMRRMRWLRVRKYMVTAATMVEPFTECFLHGALGSLALRRLTGVPAAPAFAVHVLVWCALDYWLYWRLATRGNVEAGPETPYFARPAFARGKHTARSWLASWLLRETLALPIWLNAMAGRQLIWRDRTFYLRPDNTAVEIADDRQ
ncbi:glycosyl transferase family 21-domain-containing protein [Dipodascopsis tothii]|uniref:glycosyl transferase family 21-domain-containing protein n=1 Tax=Dipodascopsis tothii TaxID=44089 RepID=UPI0034CF6080